MKPKIALVHDFLTQRGGAELVLRALHELYPEAPIYTLVADKKQFKSILPAATIIPSFLNYPAKIRMPYQWMLPLMPMAVESFDCSGFDVVISSSSAFAHGVITKSTTLHLSYCHTPTRYLWSDTHSYVRDVRAPSMLRPLIPATLHHIRLWNRLSADRVDKFIANSKTVQERIKKYYRRNSDIVYPPVDLTHFTPCAGKGSYFLAGGRLVSYKRLDLVVEAFNRLGFPLKIFGEGPELGNLKRISKKNIEFVGYVNDQERGELYKSCIAFLNPQEEDLGITVIEAGASGRPVIALAAGGALETVIPGVTGEFFYDQDIGAIISAVLQFKPERYDSKLIREHAMKYGIDRFKDEMSSYVNDALFRWRGAQEIKRIRETHKS